MRLWILSLSGFLLAACVSGAPRLTAAQAERLDQIELFKAGQTVDRSYAPVQSISGADCSGAPVGGRVWGDAEKAVETLRKKAAALGADAVLEVSCGAVPLVNNCWAAQKCSGQAVRWQ